MFTAEEFDEWRAKARLQMFEDAYELIDKGYFVATSSHPNWRGKIRCKFCKSTGYGGSVEENPYWWGQRHGPNCKQRS